MLWRTDLTVCACASDTQWRGSARGAPGSRWRCRGWCAAPGPCRACPHRSWPSAPRLLCDRWPRPAYPSPCAARPWSGDQTTQVSCLCNSQKRAAHSSFHYIARVTETGCICTICHKLVRMEQDTTVKMLFTILYVMSLQISTRKWWLVICAELTYNHTLQKSYRAWQAQISKKKTPTSRRAQSHTVVIRNQQQA